MEQSYKEDVRPGTDKKSINKKVKGKPDSDDSTRKPEYTWVPFFKELAHRVRDFHDNQSELVEILRDAGMEKGLTDKLDGNLIPLHKIDPFSFFSLLNKSGDDTNLNLLSFLAKRLDLKEKNPTDLAGVPTSNGTKAWLFAYAEERKPADIDILWELFDYVLKGELNESLFNRALAIKEVGIAKLTQSMFYINPGAFLPYDRQTRRYLDKLKFQLKVESAKNYSELLSFVQQETDMHFWEISYESWLLNHTDIEDKPAPDLAPPEINTEANSTPIQTDSPATEDLLNRKPFAKYLSLRFSKLWQQTNNENSTRAGNSFVTHLYSEWGSGKSTFLHLLKNELEQDTPLVDSSLQPPPQEERWLVVEFNAWENQHVQPLWWPLLQSIIDQSLKKRSLWLKLKEHWRRFSGAWGVELVGALIVVLAVVVMWNITADVFEAEAGSKFLENISKSFIAIGSAVVFLATIFRSLLPGTASAAKNFQSFKNDPLISVKRHFSEFLTDINQPIMVFIDDLDRCREENVVTLLESLHTLFNDQRIFYLVAADKKWISTCFHNSYKDIAEHIENKERPTGHLFIEKLFQISIGLPAVSNTIKQKYVGRLLGIRPTSGQNNNEDLSATEIQVIQKAESFSDFSSLDMKKSKVVEEVMFKSISTDFDKDIEHRLQKYIDYLDPNPRFMKLLINSYGINVVVAMASGLELDDFDYEHIAVWSILSLRYPALAQELTDSPKLLDTDIINNQKNKFSELAPAFNSLLSDKQFTKLYGGRIANSGQLRRQIVMALTGQSH